MSKKTKRFEEDEAFIALLKPTGLSASLIRLLELETLQDDEHVEQTKLAFQLDRKPTHEEMLAYRMYNQALIKGLPKVQETVAKLTAVTIEDKVKAYKAYADVVESRVKIEEMKKRSELIDIRITEAEGELGLDEKYEIHMLEEG